MSEEEKVLEGQEDDNLAVDESINDQEVDGDAAAEKQEVQKVEAEEEEIVVTIGDEEPEQQDVDKAPEWVRELRKNQRDLQKRNRELEERLKKQSEPEKTVLGAKPTLEGLDFDTDKFEEALTSWYENKRKYEAEQEDQRILEEEQKIAWQGRLDSYVGQRDELGVKDFEDAETDVQNVLSKTQQGIILQGAENSARVIYALGKHPAKAKELASIIDPVRFSFAIAKLEEKLKVTTKKPATAPEKKITGSSAVSGGDSTLEKLRAEAEKTGDFTKVTAYKRKIRNSK